MYRQPAALDYQHHVRTRCEGRRPPLRGVFRREFLVSYLCNCGRSTLLWALAHIMHCIFPTESADVRKSN